MAIATYCINCDAEEGQCDCGGARYLEAVQYERRPDGRGWRVPDGDERELWEKLERRRGLRVDTPPPKPTSLERLVEQLDYWLFLGKATRERLEQAYAKHPLRVTRLCETTINGASSGRLSQPDLYLDARLKEELA